jgi:hypothetical protein
MGVSVVEGAVALFDAAKEMNASPAPEKQRRNAMKRRGRVKADCEDEFVRIGFPWDKEREGLH